MSIGWVSKANGWVHELVDDGELDTDEVARDAKLLRGVALVSMTMLVVFSAVLAVALRMLLGR